MKSASASDITNLMSNSETFLVSSKTIAYQEEHNQEVLCNDILVPHSKKLSASSPMTSSASNQSYWLSSLTSMLHSAFSVVTCKTCSADLKTHSTASSRKNSTTVNSGSIYRQEHGQMKGSNSEPKWAIFKISSLVFIYFNVLF